MQKGLLIKDEVDTNYVDERVSKTKALENTVRPLCLLILSVLFWVFVLAIFL